MRSLLLLLSPAALIDIFKSVAVISLTWGTSKKENWPTYPLIIPTHSKMSIIKYRVALPHRITTNKWIVGNFNSWNLRLIDSWWITLTRHRWTIVMCLASILDNLKVVILCCKRMLLMVQNWQDGLIQTWTFISFNKVNSSSHRTLWLFSKGWIWSRDLRVSNRTTCHLCLCKYIGKPSQEA